MSDTMKRKAAALFTLQNKNLFLFIEPPSKKVKVKESLIITSIKLRKFCAKRGELKASLIFCIFKNNIKLQ